MFGVVTNGDFGMRHSVLPSAWMDTKELKVDHFDDLRTISSALGGTVDQFLATFRGMPTANAEG